MVNNRKKVLIFTLQGYFNYGNRLQNYALSSVLRKMGYSVSTYNQNSLKHRLFDSLTLRTPLHVINSGNPSLYRFTNKFIKNDYSLRKDPDYIIVGSDQVWNPDYLNSDYLPLHIPSKCDHIISYAASIGKSSLSEKEKELFAKYLPAYSSISVREKGAKTLLSKIIDLPIDVVLDPTLLIDRGEWSKIADMANKNILPKQRYVFNYVLGKNTDISDALKYASKKQLDVISLSDRDKSKYGVEEFLALIKGADFICTDSFHACIFSFIFDKPFIVYKRNNSGELYRRIEDLLNTLNIQNRESNGVAISDKAIIHDYSISYAILNSLVNKSMHFLKEAMDK